MAHDWASDVKKYVPSPDDAAVKGIIKHLGNSLQSKDSSLVACTDKAERDRIRGSFLKNNLGLSIPDAELDQPIVDTRGKMKGDHDKSRVAFYYLLAEK